jgi:hypothetical protein
VDLESCLDSCCNFVKGGIPGDAFKAFSLPLEGIVQPFGIILKVADAQTLAAYISQRTRASAVASDFDDLVSFCNHL